ncbi:MAG: hypothetical protein JO366_19190 [Methylobacteriaceae bacterium]|nr:hypothetical protein [Methylobacteriaceae bacterium]MBV9246930.1 hypothetical protein [Methylobacteriaceae bacterium]
MSNNDSQTADFPDEFAYLSRLLTHASLQPCVSGNTLFQLSIMLARISIEQHDHEYAREITNVLFECLKMTRQQREDNVVNFSTYSLLKR